MAASLGNVTVKFQFTFLVEGPRLKEIVIVVVITGFKSQSHSQEIGVGLQDGEQCVVNVVGVLGELGDFGHMAVEHLLGGVEHALDQDGFHRYFNRCFLLKFVLENLLGVVVLCRREQFKQQCRQHYYQGNPSAAIRVFPYFVKNFFHDYHLMCRNRGFTMRLSHAQCKCRSLSTRLSCSIVLVPCM